MLQECNWDKMHGAACLQQIQKVLGFLSLALAKPHHFEEVQKLGHVKFRICLAFVSLPNLSEAGDAQLVRIPMHEVQSFQLS